MRLGFELAMQFWIQTKANEAAAAASDWVWVETQHTIDCVISGQKFDETQKFTRAAFRQVPACFDVYVCNAAARMTKGGAAANHRDKL